MPKKKPSPKTTNQPKPKAKRLPKITDQQARDFAESARMAFGDSKADAFVEEVLYHREHTKFPPAPASWGPRVNPKRR